MAVSVRVFQHNVGRSETATEELSVLAIREEIDIIAVHEPAYQYQRIWGLCPSMKLYYDAPKDKIPKTALAINNPTITTEKVSEYCKDWCTTIKIYNEHDEDVFIMSVFIPQMDDVIPYLDELHEILLQLVGEQVLICIDSNALSYWWSNSDWTDPRGDVLEDLVLAHNLCVLNQRDRSGRFKRFNYTDLIIVSHNLLDYVVQWHAEEEWTSSKHRATGIEIDFDDSDSEASTDAAPKPIAGPGVNIQVVSRAMAQASAEAAAKAAAEDEVKVTIEPVPSTSEEDMLTAVPHVYVPYYKYENRGPVEENHDYDWMLVGSDSDEEKEDKSKPFVKNYKETTVKPKPNKAKIIRWWDTNESIVLKKEAKEIATKSVVPAAEPDDCGNLPTEAARNLTIDENNCAVVEEAHSSKMEVSQDDKNVRIDDIDEPADLFDRTQIPWWSARLDNLRCRLHLARMNYIKEVDPNLKESHKMLFDRAKASYINGMHEAKLSYSQMFQVDEEDAIVPHIKKVQEIVEPESVKERLDSSTMENDYSYMFYEDDYMQDDEEYDDTEDEDEEETDNNTSGDKQPASSIDSKKPVADIIVDDSESSIKKPKIDSTTDDGTNI